MINKTVKCFTSSNYQIYSGFTRLATANITLHRECKVSWVHQDRMHDDIITCLPLYDGSSSTDFEAAQKFREDSYYQELGPFCNSTMPKLLVQ